ncbi:hypothetical protein COY07_04080 [Candidatus Peregrinibacteria bacterium CG_4_10_14_0_2_um_filter_43_11]|nr:MAG: hypothetical protein COY07_04080 [Candidatus Peregrinibacteria bacterium CG_4_10_14_0_2_um_filter_43_11]
MAVVPMQKISLLFHKKDKQKVLSFLQDKGVLHLVDMKADVDNLESLGLSDEGHALQYKVAELDFAIHFLSKYESKKKGLQAMIDGDSFPMAPDKVEEIGKHYEFKEVVERCKSVESEMAHLSNEVKEIHLDQAKLAPWFKLSTPLDVPRETETVVSLFASFSKSVWEAVKTEMLNLSELLVIEFEHAELDQIYIQVIADKGLSGFIEGLVNSNKGESIELPIIEGAVKEVLETKQDRLKKIDDRFHQLQKASKELSKELKSLRVTYDFYHWQLLQKNVRRHFLVTESTVLISGWMPKKGIAVIREELTHLTKYFEIVEVEPDEGEKSPVLLENKGMIQPFQAVTNIYGLPLPSELDPTPYLAVFFIIYFGMCLTDAGYGLMMFIITWVALKYLRIPSGLSKLVRLLMYAGIFTFVMGILFGGWFGMTPDQAPAWMTVMQDGKLMFKGQTFDALGNAMQVLILSFSLGFIQTWFGVLLNFIHRFRTVGRMEAMLDNFPWVYMLTVLCIYILAMVGALPAVIQQVTLYLVYSAVLLIVLTQGRSKSNIIVKFLSGVLALYNLVGYMSAVLSYSRLLALGLATAIIGMAVNTIAALVNGIPYVGIVFAIIVLIGGHTFNILINALGSFIHSGRLQFVEFFGNFLEGGGTPFNPFQRFSKYVRVKKDD